MIVSSVQFCAYIVTTSNLSVSLVQLRRNAE